MITRASLSFIIISLLVLVLLLGCSKTENSREEINMFSKVTIPVIDTSMPTEIETATFALG
ncbi:hypothetical protein ACFLXD_02660 [Chloroflexota bacterium]